MVSVGGLMTDTVTYAGDDPARDAAAGQEERLLRPPPE